MTDSERLNFKLFCQSIIERPRPINDQPHERKELDGRTYLWCEDWRIIEICKYFFNGPAMYDADPPPNRLKGNPLFNKALIVLDAEFLKLEYKTAEAIIEELKSRRAKHHG